MGNGVGEQSIEGLTAVLPVEPLHGLLVDDIGTIFRTLVVIFPIEGVLNIALLDVATDGLIAIAPTIFVQEIGIVGMSFELTDVAIELIDTTLLRRRNTAFIASCPLAELGCGVAVLLHDFGEDDMSRIKGMLTHNGKVLVPIIEDLARTVFLVATNLAMACVLTRHEGSTRGGRDGTASIGLHELHALRSQAVDVGRGDVLLSITSQVAPPHVIAQDEDNVGAHIALRPGMSSEKEGETGEQKCRSSVHGHGIFIVLRSKLQNSYRNAKISDTIKATCARYIIEDSPPYPTLRREWGLAPLCGAESTSSGFLLR